MLCGTLSPMASQSPANIRHVRPVRPIDFPSSDPEWEMPENKSHRRMCDVLYSILCAATAGGAAVGSDQFVYFHASDNRRKCAPDGFVKLGVPNHDFGAWLTWKGGTPELCVEILSPYEAISFEEKLRRFHAMGVSEVVAFDPDGTPGRRLRAWDYVAGDLVERIIDDERTPCLTLGRWFVVAPAPLHDLDATLRLADDEAATALVPTSLERERAERERERAEDQHEIERLREEVVRLRAERG